MSGGEERLLIACNNSDEAILLNTSDGKIIHRFDLSTFKRIPASLRIRRLSPAMAGEGLSRSGMLPGRGAGSGERKCPPLSFLFAAASLLAGGSHPTALLLNHDSSRLFRGPHRRADEIAVLDTASGKPVFIFRQSFPANNTAASDPGISRALA